ncbi:ankyrin repeat domain-containing protein [Coralloluteibacterium thermophilus]|uniref:Ankyrin repeat domain-containing protein n=1 Tax=Coralloluteibacterium thermophilum TaxID=2707049 RepID=A0ABV9NHH1_9GAMM
MKRVFGVRCAAAWCLAVLVVLPLPAVGDENALDPGLMDAIADRDCAAVEARLVDGASATGTFEDYMRLQHLPVLFMAVSSGDACIIRSLIRHGAEVDVAFPDDYLPVMPLISPLTLAIRAGNPEIVEVLLEAGAHPGLVDREGNDLIPHYIEDLRRWHEPDTVARIGGLLEKASR